MPLLFGAWDLSLPLLESERVAPSDIIFLGEFPWGALKLVPGDGENGDLHSLNLISVINPEVPDNFW